MKRIWSRPGPWGGRACGRTPFNKSLIQLGQEIPTGLDVHPVLDDHASPGCSGSLLN
ncbi:hypothetical protein OHB54_02095 [Streptomyces sp. NBC_01007]|nr:hypothetical protein OHB54_02095 [Streptomyces sp. NBC_01007]